MMNSKKSITNNKTEVTINIIHESEFGIKIATGILIQKNIIITFSSIEYLWYRKIISSQLITSIEAIQNMFLKSKLKYI